MSDETRLSLRANKCANIIQSLCELFGLSLEKATEMFYLSDTSQLIEDGVADLQCRSDKYLATVIWDECCPRQ